MEQAGLTPQDLIPLLGSRAKVSEVLAPAEEWEASSILAQPTPATVTEFAHRLGIHLAIVAGRVRKELQNYRLLTHFVGSGEVGKFLNGNEFTHA